MTENPMLKYHEPQPGEETPLPVYRALDNLCYGDIVKDLGHPEMFGVDFCKAGDSTTLYWPLRTYKERVALLIAKNAIELVHVPKIETLSSEPDTEEKKNIGKVSK